jgi:two-component system CheB/CheR fusion protein
MPIVGIGLGDGGELALPQLLAALGQTENAAIVVIPSCHTAAEAFSTQLVGESGPLPQVVLQHTTVIEPNKIYLAPCCRTVTLYHDQLIVEETNAQSHPLSPIDHFLHSLATGMGDRSVGIILSGAGSDGALGLKEIGNADGSTFVQSPESAKVDSMPRNAVALAMADYVLSPTEIGRQLQSYLHHLLYTSAPLEADLLKKQIAKAIPQIAELVNKHTNHNFQHYKASTLTRRIQRRMNVLMLSSVEQYIDLLSESNDEVIALYHNLLIGVTQFFRNANAFEELSREAIADLFKDRAADDSVRIWVAGCATGEEAYSLAMLCREQMDLLTSPPEVQIFATDIDERALKIGRQGKYPSGIQEDVSPARLKRFFVKRGKQYQLAKEIREMVLFSSHNLIADPPFSRIDLISCRNLLIYLGPHLQKKLISLFHYSLKDEGYLFLGASENITSHRDLFEVLHAKYRLSRKKPTAVEQTEALATTAKPAPLPRDITVAADPHAELLQVMQRIVLDEFAPKSLVVDKQNQILCASSDMEKYLTVSGGTFENNIIKIARPGLRVGLRAALKEARHTCRKVVRDGLSVRWSKKTQRVVLTAQPMPEIGENTGLVMLIFDDAGLPLEPISAEAVDDAADSGRDPSVSVVAQLEAELTATRDEMEKLMQDMEAAHEELKASNDELLAMNEEMQSANEELQTSKEEIQASSEALSAANDDLENLLRSTQIATIFLDSALNVRKFTPTATEIYGLISADIGRPLTQLMPLADEMPPIPQLAEIVGGEVLEHTIAMQSGKYFLRRVLPYVDHSGEADGIVLTFTDITERKQWADALTERERQLSSLICSTAEGLFGIDTNGTCTFANAACARLLGYSSSSELIGRPVHQLVHDQCEIESSSMSHHRRIARAYLHGEKVHAIDGIFCRADGTSFSVEYWAYPQERDGEVVGCVVTFLDITVRLQMERELARKEAHLRQVIDNMLGFVGVLTPDGTLQEINQVALAAAAAQRSDVIGKKVWDCYWWNSDQQSANTLSQFVARAASGELVRHDFAARIAGNAHTVLDLMLVPVRDESGTIVHLVLSGIDISDRKRAEQALAASEERLALALRYSGTGIFEWDPNTDIVNCDRTQLALAGVHKSQLTGDELLSVVHQQDRKAIRLAVDRAMRGQDDFTVDFRIIQPDQQLHWLTARGKVVPSTGQHPLRLIGLTWEITEQKNTEAALKVARTLAESANSAKSAFIANMSHEIRTPMTAVLGYTDLLFARETDDEKRDQLRTIKRNGVYLLEIINDILDLSKIEAGKMEIERERFSLHQVVTDVQSMMHVRAVEQNLLFNVEYDGPIPSHVESDAKRLKQILVNLVSNAIKFTKSGSVTLVVRYLPRPRPQMQFDIIDTGIGMTEQQLARLFRAFSQGDASVSRNFGGTGLGLAISKRLAECLGGDITVRSVFGEGSTFSCTIDAGDVNHLDLIVPPRDEILEAEQEAKFKIELNCRVLVVDDRRDVRFLTRHFLDEAGASVELAEDGQQAVEFVQKVLNGVLAPVDVILMDMEMPRLDGYQAAIELRKLGFDKPIIALTADAMHGNMHRCIECGCDSYLSKPINGRALISLVEQYTKNRQFKPGPR